MPQLIDPVPFAYHVAAFRLDQPNAFGAGYNPVDYLMQHGDLAVPCSRYGRTTSDCVPYAVALAEIMWQANACHTNPEQLDELMGLVVNDHDDVLYSICQHGTEEMVEYLIEDQGLHCCAAHEQGDYCECEECNSSDIG